MSAAPRSCIGRVLGSVAVLLWVAAPARAQLGLSAQGRYSVVEHRVKAGLGVEQSSGALTGGSGTLFLGSRLEVTIHSAAGTLTADSATAVDRDVAEASVRASLLTVPWLALHAGFSARSFSNQLARQRWTALRFGGEVRMAFVGGGVTGLLHGEILPGAKVSGLERPSRAFAAGAGLEWRTGPLALTLRYDLERYDFPTVLGAQRAEQLSVLTAEAGLRLGRRNTP